MTPKPKTKASTVAARLHRSNTKARKMHIQVQAFTTEIVLPCLVVSATNAFDVIYNRGELKVSPIEIQKTYGVNCRDIFRLLFTMHQVGGRDKLGNVYPTMWVPQMDNMLEYVKIIRAQLGTKYTSKLILAALVQQGCTESRRVKLDATPRVISGAELVEYKEMVKNLRKHEHDLHQHAIATYWN